MPRLTDPLRGVVGEKAAKRLVTLGPGLRTIGDLLGYYPRRYETRGELTDLAGLRDGEHVTVQAMIASVSTRPMRNRRGSIFEAVVTDGGGQLTLTFFGQGRPGWGGRQTGARPARRVLRGGIELPRQAPAVASGVRADRSRARGLGPCGRVRHRAHPDLPGEQGHRVLADRRLGAAPPSPPAA